MAPVTIQSEDYRGLLDLIDSLRSIGIGRYVALPEIIVCGDQSSGKSSVLEAISGLSFPTKDNLCTRFATELILRRCPDRSIKVSIIPHHSRTAAEKERLAEFSPDVDADQPDLGRVVEAAKTAMGLNDSDAVGKRFSSDVLRVEMSGPEQEHLTLVDLPGLFRAGNSEQSTDEAPVVRNLVLDYMRRERSIILAVVSASYDFANQEVTQLSRALDPHGRRTMGLITKPDKLDTGSDSERAFVKLAENKDVKLQLGWHVLKNRSFEMRDASSSERDASEKGFFQRGAWAGVNPAHLGVGTLRPRLSNALKNQILDQLPRMLQEIGSLVDESDHQLSKLGQSRSTELEQRQYLSKIGSKFQTTMRSAVDGIYNDINFFGNDDQTGNRLRADIQNILGLFSERIRLFGQEVDIVDDDDPNALDLKQGQILRSEYALHVKAMMKNLRGCELPGLFSPVVVGRLFRQQCTPWKSIAESCVDDVIAATFNTILGVLKYVAVPDTAEKLLQEVVNKRMDELKGDLSSKVTELFEPYYDGHPITYNHYLTDTVQKMRNERHEKKMTEALQRFESRLSRGSGNGPSISEIRALFSDMTVATKPNMEDVAASDAIDYMEAYYKVAMKKFVDEIAVNAVEQCLVRKLPQLFSPEMVYDLSPLQVARVASETDEVMAERRYLNDKILVLKKGMQELRRLDRHGAPTYRAIESKPSPKINEIPHSNFLAIQEYAPSVKHKRVESSVGDETERYETESSKQGYYDEPEEEEEGEL